jgi:hypothetical protein
VSSTIGKMSFIEATIPGPAQDGSKIRYAHGINNSGTHENEIVQIEQYPDGGELGVVIMRGGGLSRTKAEAICMILNAPEA